MLEAVKPPACEADWEALLAAWSRSEFDHAAAIAEDSTRLRSLAPLVSSNDPVVIAQLGQSLDGRIAAKNGESRYINGPAAIAHLHRLRALVDAVVVGARTVIQDNPTLTVRHVVGTNPTRVAVDPRGRLEPDCQLFTDSKAPTLRIIGSGIGTATSSDLVLPTNHAGRIDPAVIVSALADQGATRLLIEGGANTIAEFIQSGLVDRLHVLVGPIILGAGRTGIDLAGIDRLDQALRPSVTSYSLGGDTLFDCEFSGQANKS